MLARPLQGRVGAGPLAKGEVEQGSPSEQLGAFGEEAQGLVQFGQGLGLLLLLHEHVGKLC